MKFACDGIPDRQPDECLKYGQDACKIMVKKDCGNKDFPQG